MLLAFHRLAASVLPARTHTHNVLHTLCTPLAAFPLKHQQKDLRLALAEADVAGQPLAVTAAANDLYIRARAQGYGDADFSAVLEAVAAQGQEKELPA